MVKVSKYSLKSEAMIRRCTMKYGGIYIPNFWLFFIAHLRRRKLNYDVVNWITTSKIELRCRKFIYDIVNELRRRKLNYNVVNELWCRKLDYDVLNWIMTSQMSCDFVNWITIS